MACRVWNHQGYNEVNVELISNYKLVKTIISSWMNFLITAYKKVHSQLAKTSFGLHILKWNPLDRSLRKSGKPIKMLLFL